MSHDHMSADELNPTSRATGAGRPASHASKGGIDPLVVLTGNPNCGKTTLFNALTGLRARVGNYAGVTVERKEGRLLGPSSGLQPRVLDLPGTYSLSPQSLDEQVSRDVLLGRLPELPSPALIVIVVDASNLQRNLYYATQVLELGYPTLVALNMMDVARENGHEVDTRLLAEELGAPVVPIVASSGDGLKELREAILGSLVEPSSCPVRVFCELPPAMRLEADRIAVLLAEAFRERRPQAAAEALLILSNEKALASSAAHYPAHVTGAVSQARTRLVSAGIDWRSATIEGRYSRIARIQELVTVETGGQGETFSDRLDKVLTHKIWGTAIFLGLMALMFQSIFTLAHLPMNALQAGVGWLGDAIGRLIPPGDLNSLLVHGVVAGVGAVVVFLPQILLLFLFIGFLEDTGYMARAAFLMDRLMSKVGLHGKSFIPMLSSFACAIPGIMATRTIESPKDRLVTILVSPLMTCSARLPVYTILISASIPDSSVFGVFSLRGLTMLSMYLLGVSVALLMAWVFKKTLLKGEPPLLIMELPPYKRPLARVVARHMWDRSKVFLANAGTVILGINVVLWFLATYPHDKAVEERFSGRRQTLAVQLGEAGKSSEAEGRIRTELAGVETELAGARLRGSFAGGIGRMLEPVIAPLGFDWKIGIGLVSSFAAREVFVSTMATVYNVSESGSQGAGQGMVEALQAQRRPDGTRVYTALTGITLMVFYVFALQCVSTVAVVRRETNSWRWPLFQWVYMGTLAWGFAFATRHLGQMLGW